jgi:fibronectin-binding autotransporter adhesin
MKIKKLLQLGLASVLSVSSLLLISVPAALAAGPYTCTWTGATDDNFSTAGNWSGCNSAAPQPGDNDNLVFSVTGLSQDTTLTNDITGLNVGTITFSGTNGGDFSYIIAGNAFSLSSGITDNSTITGTALPSIEAAITLTASQTFSLTTSDDLSISSVNLGTNNLTLSNSNAEGEMLIGTVAGSGELLTDPSQSAGFYEVTQASPDFTGSTSVGAGDLGIGDPGALGSGSITVDNGATLTGIFESKDVTIANPLTIDGNGINVAGIAGALNFNNDCPSNLSNTSCVNDGIVTISGPVTLTGDSTVGTDATANFTGGVSGGFTLTIASGFTGTIEYNSASGSSGSSTAAPTAPDTGLALIAAHPLETFVLSTATAFLLLVLARRLKPVKR